MQPSLIDRKDRVAGDDIDLVGIDTHPVLGQAHRQVGCTGDDRHQGTLEIRIQVLNDDERHADIRRHNRKERLQRVDAARGCADPDNQAVALRHGAGPGGLVGHAALNSPLLILTIRIVGQGGVIGQSTTLEDASF